MSKNNIIRILIALLCPSAILCLHGCDMANLDLCEGEHPHKGQLVVEYDWSGVKDAHPDSMVVVALRPLFREKVLSNWASDVCAGEKRRYGRFVSSAANGDMYFRPMKAEQSRDSIFLPFGEWKISSYTYNQATLECAGDYTQDILDNGSLLVSKMVPINILPVKYEYWSSRNPSARWVDASVKSSLCMAEGTLVIDEHAYDRKDYKVRLRPRRVAQKINITFDAEVKETGVVVDSIVCAVSGLSGSMNISTKELDVEDTYMAIFEPALSRKSSGSMNVSGTIYAPGLVRSASQTLQRGSGILSVSVFISYDDDDNIHRQCRLDASCNLYDLLSATPSLKTDKDGKTVQARSELTLSIRNRLLISKNKLSNAGTAQGVWTDETVSTGQ
ncbi:MAG: hypothetical protein K2J00_00865 [Bacteroidaceae bacterium]|nr:hypothetical protein [Bacteroidaceae bacterium]